MRKTGLAAIMVGMMLALPADAAECGAGGSGAVSILYDTGQTTITAAHRQKLTRFVDVARTKNAVCIFAQVDAQGSKAANARVAAARAANARDFLVSQGVPGDRIQIAREAESFTFFGLLDASQAGERKVTFSYQD